MRNWIIAILGELFAVGSYNTLRLCDTAGVGVSNIYDLIKACFVKLILENCGSKKENQQERSFGIFFFAGQHYKKMSSQKWYTDGKTGSTFLRKTKFWLAWRRTVAGSWCFW